MEHTTDRSSQRTLSITKYGRKAFYDYIDRNGRQSTRKDLLTKILTAEPETGALPLDDEQTIMEVGNLVFAGTGSLIVRNSID